MILYNINRTRSFLTLLSFTIVAICIYLYLSTNVFVSRKSKLDATPIKLMCEQQFKVSLTFDDGPHPINTPWIIKTLNKYQIKAGFFLLGTSIETFLNYHKLLTVHQLEPTETALLLQQNYSSIERLFEGHDIYLHGWLHEKNNETYLQATIDNIATQLVELGLLKGFKPIYRAPWGIGTSPEDVKKRTLFVEILKKMGIIPAYWNIDSGDYEQEITEEKLIRNVLEMICQRKGGHILLHDIHPTTAHLLDRLIRSIIGSNHSIVEPSEIFPRWKNQMYLDRTRRYVKLLRDIVRRVQRTVSVNKKLIEAFRLVDISLKSKHKQDDLLSMNDPITSLAGSIQVKPSIDDI